MFLEILQITLVIIITLVIMPVAVETSDYSLV